MDDIKNNLNTTENISEIKPKKSVSYGIGLGVLQLTLISLPLVGIFVLLGLLIYEYKKYRITEPLFLKGLFIGSILLPFLLFGGCLLMFSNF
jgi:hypothetical protein